MYFFRLCTNDNINIFFGQFSGMRHVTNSKYFNKNFIKFGSTEVENSTKQTIERILTLKAQTIEKFLLK